MTPNLGLEAGQAAIIPFTNSLNAGRWRQAEGLARIEAAFSTSPEAKAQAQVNIWLARDLALGPQAIAEETEQWDTKELPPVYDLYRLILIRQDDNALNLVHQLLADQTLTTEDLITRPEFHRLREEGKLGRYIAQLPPLAGDRRPTST